MLQPPTQLNFYAAGNETSYQPGAFDAYTQYWALSDKPTVVDFASKPPQEPTGAAKEPGIGGRLGIVLPTARSGISAPHEEKAGKNEEEAKTEVEISKVRAGLDQLRTQAANQNRDLARPKPDSGAPIPQPEISTLDNAFSTFSLNISDVSFKLAAASLEKGVMPDAATVRSEEFINAFDYRDP